MYKHHQHNRDEANEIEVEIAIASLHLFTALG
jgi:hypothetical protein